MTEKANAHNGRFCADFDKDGSKIVSGGQDGTIKVWALVQWSRKDHLLFKLTTRRFVVLLLWLNNNCMKFPDDVLDLLIKACL